MDNIIVERFWRNIKYEETYLKDYESPRKTRLNIRDYIDFYIHERPHQSLDDKTPSSIYFNETGSSLPFPSWEIIFHAPGSDKGKYALDRNCHMKGWVGKMGKIKTQWTLNLQKSRFDNEVYF